MMAVDGSGILKHGISAEVQYYSYSFGAAPNGIGFLSSKRGGEEEYNN